MTKKPDREEINFNREIYKTYIRKEVSHPDTLREKDRFVRTHWESKKRFIVQGFPAFGFSLSVLIIMVLLGTYFFRILAQSPKAPRSEIGDVLTNGASQYKIQQNNVSVMRVSSKIGPTMVYQKMYDDVPLTIVWVFPGEIN